MVGGNAALSSRELFQQWGAPVRRMPGWLLSTVADLNRLLELDADWDGHQAAPVRFEAAEELLELMVAVAPYAPFHPWVTGTSDGGVMAEWRTDQQVLQVEVDSTLDISLFYENAASGSEWEGRLGEEPEGIEKLLWRLGYGG